MKPFFNADRRSTSIGRHQRTKAQKLVQMISKNTDSTDIFPGTIRHTSDHLYFDGAQVLVCELPETGNIDLPDTWPFYSLWCQPMEDTRRMVLKISDSRESRFVDHGMQFHPPEHRWAGEWEGGGKVVHFRFCPAFLEKAATDLGLDPRILRRLAHRELRMDKSLEMVCSLLWREVEHGCRHGAQYFEALIRAMAALLVQKLAAPQSDENHNPRIERAIRFLEHHFQQAIDLKDVANVAGLSLSHFCRVFREVVGVSPHDLLVNRRLYHARKLIASRADGESLASIAREAEFYDQAHLNRHFRRVYGQAPGQWRKSQAAVITSKNQRKPVQDAGGVRVHS